MSVYELARLYYPRLWDKSRLEALVAVGRLSEAEAGQIMGSIPTTQEEGGEKHAVE